MSDINEAYKVLSDPEMRSNYDRIRSVDSTEGSDSSGEKRGAQNDPSCQSKPYDSGGSLFQSKATTFFIASLCLVILIAIFDKSEDETTAQGNSPAGSFSNETSVIDTPQASVMPQTSELPQASVMPQTSELPQTSVLLTDASLEPIISQCAPNVAPTTMTAIIKVESGGNPLAINVNGKKRLARQPASIFEAVAWASWLIDKGYSADLGLMQVNSRKLERLGLPVEAMFHPCYNIAAGAQILTEKYANATKKFGSGQAALRAAISSYKTGNYSSGFVNGYVHDVAMASAGQMLSHEGLTEAQPPLEDSDRDKE